MSVIIARQKHDHANTARGGGRPPNKGLRMKRVKFAFVRQATVTQTGKCYVDVDGDTPEAIIENAEAKSEELEFSRFLVKNISYEDIDWDFEIEMIEEL